MGSRGEGPWFLNCDVNALGGGWRGSVASTQDVQQRHLIILMSTDHPSPPPSASSPGRESNSRSRGRGGRGRGRQSTMRRQEESEATLTKEQGNDHPQTQTPPSKQLKDRRAHGRGRGRGGRGGRGRGGRNRQADRNDSGRDSCHLPSHDDEVPVNEFSDQVTVEKLEGDYTTTPAVLQLPCPPTNVSTMRQGAPMVITRQSQSMQQGDEEKKDELPNNNVDDLSPTNNERSNKQKSSKKKKNRKSKNRVHDEDDPSNLEEEEDVSPVKTSAQVLESLPAQEVSITANTQIKVLRRNESSMSDTATPTTKQHVKSKKGYEGDSAKAARRFNNEIRQCVNRGDPDHMNELLREKRNHRFALDPAVLETVLAAYVVAAMFNDAVYCLRHNTVPETLTPAQAERILTCMPQNLRNSSAYAAADMINALCIATAFDAPTKRTYFLRIVRGIALEFLEEVTTVRERICSSHCERLVRSALCVVNARLKPGKKANELVIFAGDQLGVFVPDTSETRGIQPGDAVSILPYAGPYPLSAESLDRNMIEASVVNINPMVVRLQDKLNPNLYNMLTETSEGNVYRIDRLANRMGYNRQLSAVVAITSPQGDPFLRDPRRPCPQLINAISAMDENIDRIMKSSGGAGKSGLTSTAALCSEAIPWNVEDESDDVDQYALRSSVRLGLDKYGVLDNLNASQQLAVEGAVSNRLTLVQGPPGTGKTMVAIRIIEHWARLAKAAAGNGEAPAPILATSDSNIAVDNLVEGCAAVGLRVVRIGRPEAVRPELLRFCIDKPPSSYDRNTNNSTYFSATKERALQIKNAQVICCTCIGSGGDILDGMTFERILLDEATQATEPAVLVPLMRGCRQLVLVGDHCQLPPTVLSSRAEEEGHGVPLFSRMVACGVPPFMLDTQYRMHPCIAMFPSDLFYGGLLKNGVTPPERRPLAGFPWPREEFPVAFVPVDGIEMDESNSKYNEAEAAAAFDVVAALLHGGQCRISDIAVVTPYAAQARLIRRLVRKLAPSNEPPYIEVSSVDGFQGREKEAVIFSAVRSNNRGAIGFTSDWRRVNVSFTRARRALIVIGNDLTLRRGDPDTWAPWLAWVDAFGLNMDRPGTPRGRYDPEQLRRVRGGTTAAEMLKDVLARQQAQLEDAERRQERAVRSTEGHIRAAEEGKADEEERLKMVHSIEKDLALMENTDGNWDDSDIEDDVRLSHSVSRVTLSSGTSFNDTQSSPSEPKDAWDL